MHILDEGINENNTEEDEVAPSHFMPIEWLIFKYYVILAEDMGGNIQFLVDLICKVQSLDDNVNGNDNVVTVGRKSRRSIKRERQQESQLVQESQAALCATLPHTLLDFQKRLDRLSFDYSVEVKRVENNITTITSALECIRYGNLSEDEKKKEYDKCMTALSECRAESNTLKTIYEKEKEKIMSERDSLGREIRQDKQRSSTPVMSGTKLFQSSGSCSSSS